MGQPVLQLNPGRGDEGSKLHRQGVHCSIASLVDSVHSAATYRRQALIWPAGIQTFASLWTLWNKHSVSRLNPISLGSGTPAHD